MKNKKKIFFISGIDTGIGKTIATGLIARGLMDSGVTVITQKGVQTGCVDVSEDIVKHRQLMGVGMLPEDTEGLTCQYLFATPCSPHLAARIEKITIEPDKITQAAEQLGERYEVVLLEGAGGLFVPLQEDYTLIDYLAERQWPALLVTSSRLGSINHTLASLEALKHRDITLAGVIYNRHNETEQLIAEDSLNIISCYLRKYGFGCPIVEMLDEKIYTTSEKCNIFSTLCA